ncbi:MAG: ABC transporter permease [Bdellovibrionaceae bacterium]|nr:ABC transporter permease [Pseudobdellovibrionaceae bacterium]
MFKNWNWPAIFSFTLLTALAEILIRTGLLPDFLFPAPSTVLQTLVQNSAEFSRGTGETLKASLAGLALSIVCGIAVAVGFSLSDFLKRAILPFAVFFQTVPIIAVAPLLVIYFGFGMPTVISAAFIVSIFPIIANTLLGLESVEPGKLDLLRLYRASPWQILLKLRLPQAYGSIYAGLKTATGLAIIGAIAGEFVAGGGLGALIDSARTQQRIDIVFGALILLSLMGLACISGLKLTNRLVQKFRPYGIHLKD